MKIHFNLWLVSIFVLMSLQVSAFGDISIEQGSTQVILPEESWDHPKGNICQFANGDLVVFGKTQIKRSIDNGQSWTNDGAHFLRFPLVYPNGSAMQFYGGVTEIDSNGIFLSTVVYTQDNGLTEEIHPSLLQLPGQWSIIAGTHTRIVQLSDGTLLHCRYGIQLSDTKPRVFVCRSIDGGASWDYVTTVAHSEAIAEGYTESELLRLPDGEILCFIRSGNGIGDNLYVSRSSDDGQTWSALTVVADRGVAPHAVLMQNGVIAVVYGRPGNWMAFSLDNGHTWTGHFEYYTGPLPPDNSNYTAVAEIESGELLAVYTRTNASDNLLSEVVGTFFTIERSAVASDADFDDSGEVDFEDLGEMASDWLN